MSLRVIIGRSNTGKSASVLDELCLRAAHREPALLLVPSAPDVSRAMELIAPRAPLGISINTMDGFLDELWARHGDGRAIATPVQRLAALEESGKDCQFSFGTGRFGSPGITALLDRLVQRVAESPVFFPDRLPEGAARELGMHALLYGQLLQRLGLIERAHAHSRVAALLGEIRLPTLIALDGFTGLTAGQERFVRRAAELVDVRVALTYDAAVPATSAASELVQRLGMAGEIVETPADSQAEAEELALIACSLGDAGKRVPARGALILSEAWGRAAEAARIVREVQDALALGYEREEIAVVFRDVAPYLQDLRRTFAEARIPVVFDARIAFSRASLGRAVTSILQLDSLSHNQLMDLLRSPYVPAKAALLDRYDAYARQSRRSGARVAQQWFGRHDDQTADFLKAARKAVALGEAQDVERRWYSLVSRMLEEANAQGVDILQDSAVARVFMDAVASLRGAGAEALTAAALTSVLGHAVVVLADEDDRERVHVMGAERARGGRYGCLVLGGLNAGEFPRTSREDALTEPKMAAAFHKAGVDVSPRSCHDDERLLFYQVITRATERLVLSRQTHDDEGRSLRGSIFLEEVLDLYRDPLTGEYFDGAPPVHRLGLDGLASDPDAPVTSRRELRQQALGHGAEPRVLDARLRAECSGNAVSEGVRRLLSEREIMSASELEAYLQCPYRWAIQRMVQPRELDERIDQAAAGRLGHDIMRRFYELLPEETGSPRVTGATLAAALHLHHEVSLECLERLGPLEALDAIACRTVVRQTAGAVEQDAALLPGFVPVAHEWSFGMDEHDAPEPFGGFSLKGRIDRIDSDGERLVLMDYKSGAIGAEHGAARFEREGIVQLPLYAAVAERRFGKPVAAALYRSFRGGKPRGLVREDLGGGAFVRTDIVSLQEMPERIESAIAAAAATVERMRRGEIPQEPRGNACPAYCPARPFCRGWSPSHA